MSYIGNAPISAAFLTDTFSGTGSQTAFTMTVAPANTSSIIVAITGVLQDPSTYSVSGTTLTFSAAPPSGTSNISVRYLGIPASGVTTTAYRTVTDTTATAGQTSFTISSYTVGYVDVLRNGVRLPASDYTATTGTTVVLNNAATAGDTITTISFYVSSVLNAIPATAGSVSASYLAGGAARSNWGAGGVLQVVYASTTNITQATTSSYVDTALTASITPISSTSKILITVYCGMVGKTANDTQLNIRILRGASTAVFDTAALNQGSATALTGNVTPVYYDSPATTSSTAYKIQIANRDNSGTVSFNINGTATMTLMEIAG
jgi:hypothetical protein